MKLKTLLKKVPLPIYPELDPETDNPRLGSTGYAIHRDSEVIADGIQTPELAEYLCHAANVLPELVAAVKHLQQNWGKNLTKPIARLNAALGDVVAEDGHGPGSRLVFLDHIPGPCCDMLKPGEQEMEYDEVKHYKQFAPDVDWETEFQERDKRLSITAETRPKSWPVI